MEKIKKAYYLFFYKLYCLFKSLSEDGWEDWKALVVVCVTNIFIIFIIDLYIKIFFKVGFILELPKSTFVILFGIISVYHYYIFLHNDRWKQYEEEFKHYSNEKNKVINLSVFFFILFVLGSLIFAFYQMSLIDWSKYR